MSASPASSSLQIGDAFGYVFRSPNWFGKILIGTVCLIFSFLVIPGLILYGYMIAIGRNVNQGRSELPPWDDIGKKLGDGFLMVIAFLVWSIPVMVLYIIGFVVGGCSTQTGTTTCSDSNAELLFFSLAGILSLLLAILAPAIWAQFIDGGLGAALQFAAVFRRGMNHAGASIVVIIMSVVAGLLSLVGIIAIFIGLLVTIPWAYYVQANLYGQFARLSRAPQPAAGLTPA